MSLPRTLTFLKRLRASAATQPTGPAPRMRKSISAAGIEHQGLHVRDCLGRLGGEDFASRLGDEHVVLDADADVAQTLRNVVRGPDIEARLDGEHHAGRE